MKNYDYHSLFYYKLIAPLQNLVGANGAPLDTLKSQEGTPEFFVAYPARDVRYEHQYEREQFLVNRSKLIVGRVDSDAEFVVLLEVARHEDTATLYKKALRHLFKNDVAIARRELVGLVEKFYELKIEDACSHERVEFGGNSNGEPITQVNTLTRLLREAENASDLFSHYDGGPGLAYYYLSRAQPTGWTREFIVGNPEDLEF